MSNDGDLRDLPEPLTPVDCDLRGFPYMPLDVVRLRDAGIGSIDAEAFRAAVISWCVAWHQVPAASLPNDDQVLCRILGYGRDLKFWKKLRAAGALHGYILCNDDRLYHPVVAEKSIEAMGKRGGRAETESAKTERQRRWRERVKQLSEQLRNAGVTPPRGASLETLEKLLVDALPPSTPPTVDKCGDDVEIGKKGIEGKGEEKVPSLRSGRAASTRGSRLPDDWTPGPEGGTYARKLGLDPKAIFTVFRNYWLSKAGKDAVKLDWPKTWQNWCIREATDTGAKPIADADLLTPRPAENFGSTVSNGF